MVDLLAMKVHKKIVIKSDFWVNILYDFGNLKNKIYG